MSIFKDPIKGSMSIDYRLESAIAFLLILGFIAAIVWLWRHPFWGNRVRSLGRNKWALASGIIALLYFTVGWMDMISWRDTFSESDTGIALEARQPRSLLDRSFSGIVGVPEWEYREKSYSRPPIAFSQQAPFVSFSWPTTEFVDTDVAIHYKHLLGTSQTGHDTLYNLLKGCKPAVVIGTLPLLFSIPIAMAMGIFAGFYGGRIDDLVVYCYSTLASIPGLLLLLAIIAALGKGMPQIAFGLGVTGWVGLCRLTRGETMKLRELEYVQAARCLGVPGWKIILRHVAPNLMHLVIITAILAFTGLVLSESVLAYLGVGLDNSWGSMIEFSRDEISRQPVIWWNLIVASIALFGLVLSVNILGDAVRDALDPRISDNR